MNPQPQDEGEIRTDQPLGSQDAARHVALLTGMTPESAMAFIAFHSGLRNSSAWHEAA